MDRKEFDLKIGNLFTRFALYHQDGQIDMTLDDFRLRVYVMAETLADRLRHPPKES